MGGSLRNQQENKKNENSSVVCPCWLLLLLPDRYTWGVIQIWIRELFLTLLYVYGRVVWRYEANKSIRVCVCISNCRCCLHG